MWLESSKYVKVSQQHLHIVKHCLNTSRIKVCVHEKNVQGVSKLNWKHKTGDCPHDSTTGSLYGCLCIHFWDTGCWKYILFNIFEHTLE